MIPGDRRQHEFVPIGGDDLPILGPPDVGAGVSLRFAFEG